MLYKAYQDISQNILEQFNKINDDIPRRTKLRIYRVCLDGEILLEGLFSALGSECTDDMDKYKSFPYDDASRIYEDYKKLKYNSSSISLKYALCSEPTILILSCVSLRRRSTIYLFFCRHI